MAGRFSIEAVFKAVDRMTAPVTRMQNSVGKMTRSMSRNLNRLNKSVNTVVSSLASAGKTALKAGAVGLASMAGAVTLLVREFSKIEDAEAAFTPLLGGAKKAKEMVDALNETAASTPFQFETLAGVTQQLLPVMNGDIAKTVTTLRMLGDTAGGNAQKLESITRGFTKAMLKGKVDMESLNMIAEAGVPIFGDLADVMGTEVNDSFFKMISAGKVTTVQLTKAFEKMTTKGGKFFNGMDIASKTTSGMWSTLQDNISLTAAELGGVLAPIVKDLISKATGIAQKVREWVKNNKELISTKVAKFVDMIKKAVRGLIAFIKSLNKENNMLERMGSIIVSIAKAFAFLGRHAKVIMILVGGLIALSVILKFLVLVITAVNLAMALNPVVWLIAGYVALIAILALVVIWWDEIVAAFLNLAPIKAAIDFLGSAADLLMEAWDGVGDFFSSLWDGVVETFNSAVKVITDISDQVTGLVSGIVDTISSIGGGVADFFGFGDNEEETAAKATPAPQIVSPQARMAQSIEETRTTSTAEVTIRDESGRAEVTSGKLGAGLSLQQTGAM